MRKLFVALAIMGLLVAIFAPMGSAWSPPYLMGYGALSGLNSYVKYDLTAGAVVGWPGQNVPGVLLPHGVYVTNVGNVAVGNALPDANGNHNIQVFETKCCNTPTSAVRVIGTPDWICGMRRDYGGVSYQSVWVSDMALGGGAPGGADNWNIVTGAWGGHIAGANNTNTCGVDFARIGGVWYAYLSNMMPNAALDKINMATGLTVATTGPLPGHVFHQLRIKRWGPQAGVYVTCGVCANSPNGGSVHHYDFNCNLLRIIVLGPNPTGNGTNEPHSIDIKGMFAYVHVRPGGYANPGTVARVDLGPGVEAPWPVPGGRIIDPSVAGFGGNGDICGIAIAPNYNAYCPQGGY